MIDLVTALDGVYGEVEWRAYRAAAECVLRAMARVFVEYEAVTNTKQDRPEWFIRLAYSATVSGSSRAHSIQCCTDLSTVPRRHVVNGSEYHPEHVGLSKNDAGFGDLLIHIRSKLS